jgi:hypothetical protein
MKMTADELLAKVKARLQVEDDDLKAYLYKDDESFDRQMMDHPHPTPEIAARNLKQFHYSHAKTMARDGNVEPLRKILTELTDDPDIANFIAAPPAPEYIPKDNPFYGRYERREERQQQVETLWRIREIVQQEIGKRGTRNTVIAIAAKVMKCSTREIEEKLTRGR